MHLLSFEVEKTTSEDDQDLAWERDFWSGVGSVKFEVIVNTKEEFDINYTELTGCAQGMEDTLGLEFVIDDEWGLRDQLKEGYSYEITNILVNWTQGDGWEIDDDVEYSFQDLIENPNWFKYIKIRLFNLYWFSGDWKIHAKIRKWRK